MKRLIILDRDGVINQDSKDFIKSIDEWLPIPGSLEAIAKLKKAECSVAIVSNQSGIGRGLFTLDTLNKIHQKMRDALNAFNADIDLILICPHHPDENCNCRKPKAQLLKDALAHFKIDPLKETVFAIGDSLRDLEAAQAANCSPLLVLTGNGQKTAELLKEKSTFIKTPVYSDLLTAVNALLGEKT